MVIRGIFQKLEGKEVEESEGHKQYTRCIKWKRENIKNIDEFKINFEVIEHLKDQIKGLNQHIQLIDDYASTMKVNCLKVNDENDKRF